MAERLEHQTLNTEGHVSLFPWARNFTLIAPWFGSHVKPLVPSPVWIDSFMGHAFLASTCKLIDWLIDWTYTIGNHFKGYKRNISPTNRILLCFIFKMVSTIKSKMPSKWLTFLKMGQSDFKTASKTQMFQNIQLEITLRVIKDTFLPKQVLIMFHI